MEKLKLYAPIVVALIAGILLQVLLAWADCKDTPGKAAVQFTEAYYRLDPAMEEYLCAKTLAAEEGNLVENYIQRIRKEAENRGFGLDNMKYVLYHIETHTHPIDDVTAEVRITADRKVSINPVFALVAKFFFIGETHKVNERLTVIKENGHWKVCGSPFSLGL